MPFSTLVQLLTVCAGEDRLRSRIARAECTCSVMCVSMCVWGDGE